MLSIPSSCSVSPRDNVCEPCQQHSVAPGALHSSQGGDCPGAAEELVLRILQDAAARPSSPQGGGRR